jgi:hypothetical protein
MRVSDMFGIFGWGSSRNVASCPVSNPGRLPIDAKGGASPVVPCWSPATTWQGAHQRRGDLPAVVGVCCLGRVAYVLSLQ